MLAEAEIPELLFKAFDANYNWPLMHLMNDIAWCHRNVKNLDDFFIYDKTNYPLNALRLNFTCNHDENKNIGPAIDRLGAAFEALTILTFTIPGIPLVFSGQEAGSKRKLAFFDKDEIDWNSGKDYSLFFKKLIQLKKDYEALWNNNDCGPMIRIGTGNDNNIFAYLRQKDESKVLVILNLSPYFQEIDLPTENEFNGFHDIFTDRVLMSTRIGLDAWNYMVLVE